MQIELGAIVRTIMKHDSDARTTYPSTDRDTDPHPNPTNL